MGYEKALDAFDIVADSVVERAGFDKTIQGQIVSCVDATIGKYKCRYQDSIFYAYASSADVSYSNGSYVYIHVPNGDMENNKTILGATKKLGTNYISQAVGNEAFEKIGDNGITSTNLFYLDTQYKKYTFDIYRYDRADNPVTVNNSALQKNLKKSTYIIAGATFKTLIPPERQARGRYGITFRLRFKDNSSTSGYAYRDCTIDQSNMIDNPYRLVFDTPQSDRFEVDGANFDRVESIQIFCEDFPDSTGEYHELLTNGDIIISALELCGAVRLESEQANGISLVVTTPNGSYFSENATAADYKMIKAEVRVKGKTVVSTEGLSFYWGSENVGIVPSSEYYCNYLGNGWKCLNDKNVVKAATETEEAIVTFNPGKDIYKLKFEDATAKQNVIKVAVVYEGKVLTKEVTITNESPNVKDISITSSDGTQFYHDIGHPNLECFINTEHPEGSYKYIWAYKDSAGVLTVLDETTSFNAEYAALVAELNQLEADIAAGTKFQNAEAAHIASLKAEISAFELIQRVQAYNIFDVQIKNITTEGTFKCSVFQQVYGGEKFLGTGSITLQNTLANIGSYSLVINNGSASYQYNEDGVSPTNKTLSIGQKINALSFTLYDNLGNVVPMDIISYTWAIPYGSDTLLVDKYDDPYQESDDKRYYKDLPTFEYDIAPRYDVKKQRNQIDLLVNYKGMHLKAQTDLTFVKQGEPGTNGTEYLIKLVPNTLMNDIPLWPMITKAGSKYFLNYGYRNGDKETEIQIENSYQFFKAQLYHNGELIWEGCSKDDDPYGEQPSKVTWSILKNKYYKENGSSWVEDETAFEIINENNGSIRYKGDFLKNHFASPRANIIRCAVSLKQKTYTATMPVICAWTLDETYRVYLKEYTGWRYALYSSDGTRPQYDNTLPFEFKIEKLINGYWEDISLNDSTYPTGYSFGVVGNTQSMETEKPPKPANLIELINRTQNAKNKKLARPAPEYDGLCVNAAITCLYKLQGGLNVGKINVPIHFLLNKYGLKFLNDWDGNSIEIDNEGGFILSPQMGAGKKTDGNGFTGVLMGQVKLPAKPESQTGLFGFYNGERSFFLNSEGGTAFFGKTGTGQIIIDPIGAETIHGDSESIKDKAMLYSRSFWKEYVDDGGARDGLPKDYSDDNRANEGLLIDLTTPEIVYGNKNFTVNADGHAHIAGGGDIAGWVITDTDLYSNIDKSQGRITLRAGTKVGDSVVGPGKIFSHNHDTLTKTGDGFYLSYDGFSLGSKLKFTKEGKAYIGNGAVAGSGNYWTIDGNSTRSYIAYGAGDDPSWAGATEQGVVAAKVYLGTDGLSLGSKFSVSPLGDLKAYSGEIGGWLINGNTLESQNIELHSDGSISTKNDTWSISKDGIARFRNVLELPENNTYIGDQNLQQYIEENSGAKFLWPNLVNDDPIADGASNKVLEWDFENDAGAEIAISATFAFDIVLTVINDEYTDAELTVTYKLDNVVLESYTETYGDGDHILTISHIFKMETAGIHSLTIEIAMNGGSLS